MESHALDLSLYKEALIVLGGAAVVIPLFHRLRISPVLGFILIGVFVGPFGIAQLAPVIPWLSAVTITDPERNARENLAVPLADRHGIRHDLHAVSLL